MKNPVLKNLQSKFKLFELTLTGYSGLLFIYTYSEGCEGVQIEATIVLPEENAKGNMRLGDTDDWIEIEIHILDDNLPDRHYIYRP